MNQLIECVPNFSEGNDLTIIKQITDEIEKVGGVKYRFRECVVMLGDILYPAKVHMSHRTV